MLLDARREERLGAPFGREKQQRRLVATSPRYHVLLSAASLAEEKRATADTHGRFIPTAAWTKV